MGKHKPEYHKNYRARIIEEAIKKLGDKCSCLNCVLPKGSRPLKLIPIIPINQDQGQYGIALYAKREKYRSGIIDLRCPDCWPVCNHDYRSVSKQIEKKSKESKKEKIRKILTSKDRLDRKVSKLLRLFK